MVCIRNLILPKFKMWQIIDILLYGQKWMMLCQNKACSK